MGLNTDQVIDAAIRAIWAASQERLFRLRQEALILQWVSHKLCERPGGWLDGEFPPSSGPR